MTMKVTVDHPKNHKDLNQCLLHLYSKLGDSSLKEWLVIAQTNVIDTQMDTHKHIHRQRQYPKAQTGLG